MYSTDDDDDDDDENVVDCAVVIPFILVTDDNVHDRGDRI